MTGDIYHMSEILQGDTGLQHRAELIYNNTYIDICNLIFRYSTFQSIRWEGVATDHSQSHICKIWNVRVIISLTTYG